MAIQVYKIKKGTAPIYLKELFRAQTSDYEMRDNQRMTLPLFNTVSYGKNSFSYMGAKLWNHIPIAIKNSVSLSTFKSAFTNWLLTSEDDITVICQ